MKRNSQMSPAASGSVFTVFSIAAASLGLAAIATTSKAAEEKEIIDAELKAGTAMCQAAVLEFVSKLTEKDADGKFVVLPSATEVELPTMCEIQQEVERDIRSFQRVKHPVCVDIARQIFEIERILIALIRANFGMSSWIPGIPMLSPMDMWERLDMFLYDLFHGGDMILIQQNIRDANRLAELSKWADELKLLKLSIWEELMDIRKSGGTAAGKACVATALSRAKVTIPFLVELSQLSNPPLLQSGSGIPIHLLTEASCRAMIARTSEKLYKYFVEKGDEDSFIKAYEEMQSSISGLTDANAEELEKVVNGLLTKFMV